MNNTKKHKKGDIREDGMKFWQYIKSCHNGEYWVTQGQFEEMTFKYHQKQLLKKRKLEWEARVMGYLESKLPV